MVADASVPPDRDAACYYHVFVWWIFSAGIRWHNMDDDENKISHQTSLEYNLAMLFYCLSHQTVYFTVFLLL